MTLAADLKESVRQWVLSNLPYDKTDNALVAYLDGLDAHGLLVRYHNWVSRFLEPRPRTVRKSQAFLANPITSLLRSELVAIIDDIEHGRDLKKYLSRRIEVAVAIPGSPLAERRDLDLMLNDWGVHHLHVSTKMDPDGYVQRRDELLFAVFQPDTAFLVDIMNHKNWASEKVLEIVVAEWPNEGLVHEVWSPTRPPSPARSLSEAQRLRLRNVGTNAAFEVAGRLYFPGGGMVGSGTTIAATRDADYLLLHLEAFADEYEADPEGFRTAFEQQHGVVLPTNPDFHFTIMDDGYGVSESNTGIALRFDR